MVQDNRTIFQDFKMQASIKHESEQNLVSYYHWIQSETLYCLQSPFKEVIIACDKRSVSITKQRIKSRVVLIDNARGFSCNTML